MTSHDANLLSPSCKQAVTTLTKVNLTWLNICISLNHLAKQLKGLLRLAILSKARYHGIKRKQILLSYLIKQHLHILSTQQSLWSRKQSLWGIASKNLRADSMFPKSTYTLMNAFQENSFSLASVETKQCTVHVLYFCIPWYHWIPGYDIFPWNLVKHPLNL